MSPWLGFVLGAFVIGPVFGFVAPLVLLLVLAALDDETGGGVSPWTGAIVMVVVPLILPAALLFWKSTRPWGAGVMVGSALVSIVLAGACSWILAPV